jgi:hypothetical protein
MKRFIFVLIATLFSGSLFADAIDDARLVLDTLSGKTLTAPQTLSIVDRYNAVRGFSNPWDEETNPTEYAAWPTNLEKATFFLAAVRGDLRSIIRTHAIREYDTNAAAARAAAVQTIEDEL